MFRFFVVLLSISVYVYGLFLGKTKFNSDCRCIPQNFPCRERGFKIYFNFGRKPSSCLPGLFLCCDKGTWEKVHSDVEVSLDHLFLSKKKNGTKNDSSKKLLKVNPAGRLDHRDAISENKERKTAIFNRNVINLMPSISTVQENYGFILHSEYSSSTTASYDDNGLLSIKDKLSNSNSNNENQSTTTVKNKINGEDNNSVQNIFGISDSLRTKVETSFYDNEIQSSGSSILNSDLITSTEFKQKFSSPIPPMNISFTNSSMPSPPLSNVDELNSNLSWNNTYPLKADNLSLNLQNIKFLPNTSVDSTSYYEETSGGISNNLDTSSTSDNLYNLYTDSTNDILSDLNSVSHEVGLDSPQIKNDINGEGIVQNYSKSKVTNFNEEMNIKRINKSNYKNKDTLGDIKVVTIEQANQNDNIDLVTASPEEVHNKLVNIQADDEKSTSVRNDIKMISIPEYVINTATLSKTPRKYKEWAILPMNGNLKTVNENDLEITKIHEDVKTPRNMDSGNTLDFKVGTEGSNISNGISTTQFNIPESSTYDNLRVLSLQDFEIEEDYNGNLNNFIYSNRDIVYDVTTATPTGYASNLNKVKAEVNKNESKNEINTEGNIVEINPTERNVGKVNSTIYWTVELNSTEDISEEGDIEENSTEGYIVKFSTTKSDYVELNTTERENEINSTEQDVVEIAAFEENVLELYPTEESIIEKNPNKESMGEFISTEGNIIEINSFGDMVELNSSERENVEFNPTEDFYELNSTEENFTDIKITEENIIDINHTESDDVKLNSIEENSDVNHTKLDSDIINISDYNILEGDKMVSIGSDEKAATERNIETSTNEDATERSSTSEIITTEDAKETYTSHEDIEMVTNNNFEIITNEDYIGLSTTGREEIIREALTGATSQNYNTELTTVKGHVQESTTQTYIKKTITADSTTVMPPDNIKLTTEKRDGFGIDNEVGTTTIAGENYTEILPVENIEIVSTTEYSRNDVTLINELEYKTNPITTTPENSLDKLTFTLDNLIEYTTEQVYSTNEINTIEQELVNEENNSEVDQDQYLFLTENPKTTHSLFELNDETSSSSERYNEPVQIFYENSMEFSSTIISNENSLTQPEITSALNIENVLAENTTNTLSEFRDSTVTSNEMRELELDTLKPIHINNRGIEDSKRNASKEEPISAEEPRKEENSVLGWIFNIFN